MGSLGNIHGRLFGIMCRAAVVALGAKRTSRCDVQWRIQGSS